MARRLYAWEKDGTFFLSAFREARAHDSHRPAMEFDTKLGLEDESQRRGTDLIWQTDGQ